MFPGGQRPAGGAAGGVNGPGFPMPGRGGPARQADGTRRTWIVTPRPQQAPRVRLLCFPYAGGGIGVYQPWLRHLPSDVELSLLQLPGRDRRTAEPSMRDLRAMAAQLGPELGPFDGVPLVLFGHSMGGLLAYETAHWLRDRRGVAPSLLAVSGRRAPHLPSRRRSPGPPVAELSDADFVDVVLRLGGTPPEVLADPDLRAMFLPILRADFEAVESYRHEPRPPLHCPIAAYGGTGDPFAPVDDLGEWARHTTGDFRSRAFPGGHFFLREHRDALLAALLADR